MVEIKVTDGCNNTARTEVRVRVVDCTEPVPVCYHGLSAALNPTPPDTDIDKDGFPDPAFATVWVGDFVQSGLEACTPPIRYSINRVGEQPDTNRTSLTLTCKDIGYLPVEIHAWDRAKNPKAVQPDGTLGGPNHGFCKTYIHVTDNQFNTCDTFPKGYPLRGAIFNDYGAPVSETALDLSGDGRAHALSDSSGIKHVRFTPCLPTHPRYP